MKSWARDVVGGHARRCGSSTHFTKPTQATAGRTGPSWQARTQDAGQGRGGCWDFPAGSWGLPSGTGSEQELVWHRGRKADMASLVTDRLGSLRLPKGRGWHPDPGAAEQVKHHLTRGRKLGEQRVKGGRAGLGTFKTAQYRGLEVPAHKSGPRLSGRLSPRCSVKLRQDCKLFWKQLGVVCPDSQPACQMAAVPRHGAWGGSEEAPALLGAGDVLGLGTKKLPLRATWG